MNRYASLADLAAQLSRRGDATALIECHDQDITRHSYAALAVESARLATGLLDAGLARDEAVLLLAPNSAAWIVAYLAVIRAGGLVVPLDDLSSDDEVARVLADCRARWAFTVNDHLRALEALSAAGELTITLLDDADDPRFWRRRFAEEAGPLPDIDPTRPACLLYTSGTTGVPKAVPLTHRNILFNVEALVEARLVGPEDRVALPLPLHHAYPGTIGLLTPLASGAAVVLPAGISGPEIATALRESRATILIGVPRLYSALLAALEARIARRGKTTRIAFRLLLALSRTLRRRLGLRLGRWLFAPLHRAFAPRLRTLACGGAHLEPEIAWKLEALGWEVLTGYGLTETSPLLTFSPHGGGRPGTAGRPLPGIELRFDPQPGKDFGEILARGPGVFQGYRGNPDATARSFAPGGWFHSGDLGFLDAQGYLHIVGRSKEVIVLSGGQNVLPEEVEAAYGESPYIRDAAVFEQEGALQGLLVPDAEAIRRHGAASVQNLLRGEIEDISQRLPSYQRLSGYRLTREALPRTHLGKLRRHLLPGLFKRADNAAPPAAPELSEADRVLLDSSPAKEVWAWLEERFPGTPLTLDSSPQLDLQIDSLEWVTLSLELQQRFDLALTGEAIARIVTLRDLLRALRLSAVEEGEVLPPVSELSARWLRPSGPLLTLLGSLVFALNRLVIRGLFRLRVEGLENLPAKGPCIIAPNHASLLDPLVLAAALPPPLLRQTYWAGWTGMLFAGPASRLLSRIARVFPVDPDRAPADSLALAKAVLDRGRFLAWFPEGRRSRDGRLGAFQPGVGLLLERSVASALPVRISGTFEALPSGRRWPRFLRLGIIFGTPRSPRELALRGQGDSDPARIADGLRREVEDLHGNDQV
ncbi:MAG: AMP-binding protein [Kiloniellaceae bacterium]